jgi:hypothetical protein
MFIAFIAAFITRGSPTIRERRGSLIQRIACPTTTFFTAASIDIVTVFATAPPLRQREPGGMLAAVAAGAEPGLTSFVALVTGTFLFGWVAGVLVVVKSWHLLQAPRWMLVSGAGYVVLMLVPILCGFAVTRVSGRLVSRGWGGLPLRGLALGLCGLVAGLMAI